MNAHRAKLHGFGWHAHANGAGISSLPLPQGEGRGEGSLLAPSPSGRGRGRGFFSCDFSFRRRARKRVFLTTSAYSSSYRTRPGFTLLEVILATGMLAGIALMVSILWSTLAGWQADAADQQERMRLHRVTELLREQWADRRTTTPMEVGGQEFVVTDRSIAFVTAIPILFPEWPLVAVSYTIEQVAGTTGGERYALVYEERRLTDVSAPPPTTDRDEQGRLLIRRMVLIDGARELAWQRFGRLTERQQERARAEQTRESSGDSSDSASAAEPTPTERREAERASRRSAGPSTASRTTGLSGRESLLAELDLHRPERQTDLDDPELNRWRPIEPEFVGRLNSVRLIGLVPGVLPPPRTLRTDERFDEHWLPMAAPTQEQELFACVLIVMGSP